ncbi:MAG: EFR1 family ferrodoxin [Erysipelotrichaceae bacterium]|nr:EFR1 family ferrodoxin [Erysipelotrichaceae bacterium]
MSKNVIYCFSGTGNSLFVAKRLANKLGDCDIYPITEQAGASLAGKEKIGLVFPTYFGGLPAIVDGFLKKSEWQQVKNAYVFCIVTAGGNAAKTVRSCELALKAQGVKLNYGKTVYLPTNYILWHNVPGNREQFYQKAEVKLDEIVKAISEQKQNQTLPGIFLFDLVYNHYINQKADRYFKVGDSCNGCATCVRVCPVNNIRITKHKPEYLGHCQQCLACLHYCPNQAIEAKGSKGRPRITHPHISVKEISDFHHKKEGE